MFSAVPNAPRDAQLRAVHIVGSSTLGNVYGRAVRIDDSSMFDYAYGRAVRIDHSSIFNYAYGRAVRIALLLSVREPYA